MCSWYGTHVRGREEPERGRLLQTSPCSLSGGASSLGPQWINPGIVILSGLSALSFTCLASQPDGHLSKCPRPLGHLHPRLRHFPPPSSQGALPASWGDSLLLQPFMSTLLSPAHPRGNRPSPWSSSALGPMGGGINPHRVASSSGWQLAGTKA